MSTTRTQKSKSKTQTTNPPLRYSTPAPNRPPVSNTPTPQPRYINAIHERDQRGLNRGHYGDDGNIIGPLPNPIRPRQTPMPDNGSPGPSTHIDKGKGRQVSPDPGLPNDPDPPDDHHSSDNDRGHSRSLTP